MLTRFTPFWMALLLALGIGYSWSSPQLTAPNERTRLYLALALVDRAEITVNAEIRKYGRTFDIAKRDKHFYTDKAPGTSLLATPLLAAFRALDGRDSIEHMLNIVRWGVVLPWSVLGLVALYALLVNMGIAPPFATRSVLALGVGTSFIHYGSAFFGHALVTAFAVFAAFFVQRALASIQTTASPPKRRWIWQAAAGFAGGMTFLIEYQAVIICLAMAAGYLFIRPFRRLADFWAPALGAACPIAVALIYNTYAFGGPLETSYDHLYYKTSRVLHAKGLFGITIPSWESVWGVLFSPSRGLFFCAPIVLVGFFSLFTLWKAHRWLAVYAGLSMFGYLALNTGSSVWHGGWGFGPRLLVPIFGLATVASAHLWFHMRDKALVQGLIRGWVIAGLGYAAVINVTFPDLPVSAKNPLKSVALPLLEREGLSPNLGIVMLGLEGLISLVPLALLLLIVVLVMLYTPLSSKGFALRLYTAATATILLFSVALWSHPETMDPKWGHKFLISAAKHRVWPK